MFRNLILAFVAVNVNALSLTEDQADETLGNSPGLTYEVVDSLGTVLLAPDTEILPDDVPTAGETIIDDLVHDFETRQELRKAVKVGRKSRREQRELLLSKHQPDASTK